MPLVLNPEYVRCSFCGSDNLIQESASYEIDIYYASSLSLRPRYAELGEFLSGDEIKRAARIKSEPDKETYVISHAIMRLILAGYTNSDPAEISFVYNSYNKPRLPGNPVFFNLTHSKDAFAIAVSRQNYVGIDLEEIDYSLEIRSVVRSYFSGNEQKHIFQSEHGTFDRFFLLWTRKEALLKALGAGIVDDLTLVNVGDKENDIDIEAFKNIDLELSYGNEHIIYSIKLSNCYLSVASPKKAKIMFMHLNSESLFRYLT